MTGPEVAKSRQSPLCRLLWHGFHALLFVVLALMGSALCASVLGRTLYRWKGLEIELRVVPTIVGETRLELPPLGVVSARTHRAPITLAGRLEQIQVEELQSFLHAQMRAEQLEADFRRTADRALKDFLARQIVFGALGGLLAPLLLGARRGRLYAGGALVGLTVSASLLAAALATFDRNAFHNPTYTGALRYASWAIKFGRDVFDKFEALSGQLRTIASNLHTLYGRIDTVASTLMPDEGANTLRVLHISDIHNNLAAYPFVREVADRFQVAFIVDTGDLTDFGSPFEAAIVQEIARLPYPYVFVSGNHDSREVERALAAAPNVVLLNGTPKRVEGLTVLGLPNPAASRQGLEGINVSPEEMQENAEQLWRKVKEMPQPPDIVAIHDPRQSVQVWGTVPLVLCGHLHREGIEEHEAPPPGVPRPEVSTTAVPSLHSAPSGRTIVCNAGTTGAAGTRYFDRKSGVPFTCAVLTFQRAPDTENKAERELLSASHATRAHLRAITLISLDGTLHQYSVARRTFALPDASRSPATE